MGSWSSPLTDCRALCFSSAVCITSSHVRFVSVAVVSESSSLNCGDDERPQNGVSCMAAGIQRIVFYVDRLYQGCV